MSRVLWLYSKHPVHALEFIFLRVGLQMPVGAQYSSPGLIRLSWHTCPNRCLEEPRGDFVYWRRVLLARFCGGHRKLTCCEAGLGGNEKSARGSLISFVFNILQACVCWVLFFICGDQGWFMSLGLKGKACRFFAWDSMLQERTCFSGRGQPWANGFDKTLQAWSDFF